MDAPLLTEEDRLFIAQVSSEEFASALMGVAGFSKVSLKTSRKLLARVALLDEDQCQRLLAWSADYLPWADQQAALAIPAQLRYAVDQLARHEIGHAIVGRSLGFRIGELHLSLISESGDRIGFTETTCDRQLQGIPDIVKYLEDRIVVLMAGTMAEAESEATVGAGFDQDFKESWSDHSKALDFMQILAGIKGVDFHTYYASSYPELRERTDAEVRRNYQFILDVVNSVADRVVAFGTDYAWTAKDFAAIIDACDPELRVIAKD